MVEKRAKKFEKKSQVAKRNQGVNTDRHTSVEGCVAGAGDAAGEEAEEAGSSKRKARLESARGSMGVVNKEVKSSVAGPEGVGRIPVGKAAFTRGVRRRSRSIA